MTIRYLHLFYLIVHIGNKNSFDIFIKIMRSIEMWIEDIYELDKFKTTWKSSNIYHLPTQVFFMFFFNIFIIRFLNIKKYFETT